MSKPEIFDEILAYNFKTVKVLRNIDDTKVSLIDTKYGRYAVSYTHLIYRKAGQMIFLAWMQTISWNGRANV